MGTRDELDGLEAAREVLYRNDRYGSTYVIDRRALDHTTRPGSIAVIHLGQIAGIYALTTQYAANWLLVKVSCSRRSSEVRLRHRGNSDLSARLTAWDATAADLADHPELIWDLELDTDQLTPEESAGRILKALPVTGNRAGE